MALIKCPECERDVSDKADACPQCGYPVAKQVPQSPQEVPVIPQREEVPELAPKPAPESVISTPKPAPISIPKSAPEPINFTLDPADATAAQNAIKKKITVLPEGKLGQSVVGKLRIDGSRVLIKKLIREQFVFDLSHVQSLEHKGSKLLVKTTETFFVINFNELGSKAEGLKKVFAKLTGKRLPPQPAGMPFDQKAVLVVIGVAVVAVVVFFTVRPSKDDTSSSQTARPAVQEAEKKQQVATSLSEGEQRLKAIESVVGRFKCPGTAQMRLESTSGIVTGKMKYDGSRFRERFEVSAGPHGAGSTSLVSYSCVLPNGYDHGYGLYFTKESDWRLAIVSCIDQSGNGGWDVKQDSLTDNLADKELQMRKCP